LLSSTLSVHDGSGIGWQFCISDGGSTVSAGRFNPLHRLRFLPSTARAKMQSPDEHHGIGSVMGIGGFRVDLNPVPADHRERDSWSGGSVIL
jgi:hypothetical protein